MWATSAFACPWPISCSDFNQFTISMCLVIPLLRISVFHSAIGRPYFFSIEGKYEAGPVTFSVFAEDGFAEDGFVVLALAAAGFRGLGWSGPSVSERCCLAFAKVTRSARACQSR